METEEAPMTAQTPRQYREPGWFTRNVFNKAVAGLTGLGISILSTSKGLLKDQDCRRTKAGGELLCNVW